VEVIDARPWLPDVGHVAWIDAMVEACEKYSRLIAVGVKPEMARNVLPMSLATRITMTCNLREWRHIFKLRTAKAAHPQMRDLMGGLLKQFKETIPVLFEEI
jgi:thymidylate synthase (FAD)